MVDWWWPFLSFLISNLRLRLKAKPSLRNNYVRSNFSIPSLRHLLGNFFSLKKTRSPLQKNHRHFGDKINNLNLSLFCLLRSQNEQVGKK